MCWCFKIFFRVFGNLANRIFSDCLVATYKMCCTCCFRAKSGNRNVVISTIYESKYGMIIQRRIILNFDRLHIIFLIKNKNRTNKIIG